VDILLIVLGLVILWMIIIYNSFIKLKNSAKKALSGIDVQLKRRTDLIPNLVETVKGYAKHEKETLENVVKARTMAMDASSSGDIQKMANADNMLTGALKSIFALSESYPDLKANENFLELQEVLTETEDQIAASRRIYNENATYYNTKTEIFPNNILASMFNINRMDLFEAKESERKNVKIEL